MSPRQKNDFGSGALSDSAEVNAAYGAAIVREFRPGHTLFVEGSPSSAMYLIQRGTVSIRKKRGSAQVEIARVYSNEVIGEISFFDRMPRSASAVALTQCRVLEIPFESLERIYSRVPDYLKTIIACVAERLRRANDTIRRLEKKIVADDSSETELSAALDAELDAAAALAATAGIGAPATKTKKSAA